MTTLVLCAEDDLSALWAWRGMAALGVAPLMLVTVGMLASALRWSHSVGEGAASVEVELADGRILRSDEIGGVLNRLTHLPPPASKASIADEAYAGMERAAFSLSWLHCLRGPVLNRASPQGLSGCDRGPADWAALAVQAGLPILPVQQTWPAPSAASSASYCARAFAVGTHFIGLPLGTDAWRAACARFVAATHCDLLGIDFAMGPDGVLRLAGATPLPDLRPGGAALLQALAIELGKP